MKRRILVIFFGLLMFSVPAMGQDVYRWVDGKGTVHFTDDLSLIPEEYQDQVEKKKMVPEPASPSSSPVQMPRAPDRPPAASERKDVLGHGEAWWRAQAAAWKQKLADAQRNFGAADAAVKAKEKEIEESVFRSHSQKKKLELELRNLQQKATELAKPVEEARTMLEITLPEQAEEYLADPNWVK